MTHIEPLEQGWYQDAVIYELYVRSFFDSNQDGIGDFQGLIAKLDYLVDLGVTAVWILPFYPSPLKDGGYDISDYFGVHPDYGELRDFKIFLKQAHKRGLRVITELVLNHTSDQHRWFQKSRLAHHGSFWRDFYVWGADPNRYKDARVIFHDFEQSNWTWDAGARAYYWHRFYRHQPDLNFDNPIVRKYMIKTLDYWLRMGVDGLRLDAIPYLFERENTNCENLPETHQYIKDIRAFVDEVYPNRMLLAEANQWPEDAAAYFGQGDEAHMCFHFPLMPRLFMALKMVDRFPVVDILNQTPPIPSTCQWATFLRNHDELTLEMVTDEERDYMYRVFADEARARVNLGIRRRLATLLNNDRRQIELMNALLLSLPGTPVIYYGDEIGMGDNIYLGDRDSVRTPFQWSMDRNAGFSTANPQKLHLPVIISPEYHYEAVNVEIQSGNTSSLLWWMKNIIAVRKKYKAFGRGEIQFLNSENSTVLSYVRLWEDQRILVVANLSKYPQPVELDLSAFAGCVPVELFGKNEFRPITDTPYFLSVHPYGYFWFELRDAKAAAATHALLTDTPIDMPDELTRALNKSAVREKVARQIKRYLSSSEWFVHTGRMIAECRIEEQVWIPHYQKEAHSALLIVKTNYLEGEADHFLIRVGYAEGERAQNIRKEHADKVILEYAKRGDKNQLGIFYDPVIDPSFCKGLLEVSLKSQTRKCAHGKLVVHAKNAGHRDLADVMAEPTSVVQSAAHTSIQYGDQFQVKLYHKLENARHPEVDLLKCLSRGHGPTDEAKYISDIAYRGTRVHYQMALTQKPAAAQNDGWAFMLNLISQFTDYVLTHEKTLVTMAEDSRPCHQIMMGEISGEWDEILGFNRAAIEKIGVTLAAIHKTMAAEKTDPDIKREPVTPFYQRAIFQSIRNSYYVVFQRMKKNFRDLEGASKTIMKAILEKESDLFKDLDVFKSPRLDCDRIRVCGDYKLESIVYTGTEFVLASLENEPGKSQTEWGVKRIVVKDIAAMCYSIARSVRYFLEQKIVREADRDHIFRWLTKWRCEVSKVFISAYMNEVKDDRRLLVSDPDHLAKLIRAYMVERALSEVFASINKNAEELNFALMTMHDILD